MKFIAKINLNTIGKYRENIITDNVILTDERLNQHILIVHFKEYQHLKPFLKDIIENPDFVLDDNKHRNTIILLKKLPQIMRSGRVVIKLAVKANNVHFYNSIITLMELNDRTWNQTIKNRGTIIFSKE